jgi:hypothetical protein
VHERRGGDNEAVLVEGDETSLRELAIARLKKKRDFRTHLFSYVAVNAVLV